MMPTGKPNILVMWGDDKRRELDACADDSEPDESGRVGS
jgi:hypothetical protein